MLLLHSCNFATNMNHNANLTNILHNANISMNELFESQGGSDPLAYVVSLSYKDTVFHFSFFLGWGFMIKYRKLQLIK